MTASILLLALIAVLAVAVAWARRAGSRVAEHHFRPATAPFAGPLPVDRDRERLIADLQAHPEAPADIRLRLRRPYPFA